MYCASSYAKLFIRYFQFEPEEFLREAGLNEQSLDNSDFIAAEEHRAIVRQLERLSNDGVWAARFGEHFSMHAHGAIGFAAISAPTLRQALETMVEFHAIRTNTFLPRLERRGPVIRYSMVDLTGDLLYERVLSESVIRILQSLIELVLARSVVDQFRIFFRYPCNKHVDALTKVYGCSCQFDAGFNGFEFPAEWWDVKSPLVDVDVYLRNRSRCNELLVEVSDLSVCQQVAKELELHFDRRVGGETESDIPSLTTLSTSLCISERTLSRRLKEEGTSYKALLEAARRRVSVELLQGGSLTVAEISEVLGYREPANFSRAFRGWMGRNPAAWRDQSD